MSWLVEQLKRRIARDDVSFTFARSGGPGGQHVNKVNTRVTLWFDLAGNASLLESEKRRVRAVLGGRLNSDGWMFVVSRRHRSQLANRRAATERFYELLAGALHVPKPRRPTRPTRASQRRRLNEKRLRSETKQRRAAPTRDRNAW